MENFPRKKAQIFRFSSLTLDGHSWIEESQRSIGEIEKSIGKGWTRMVKLMPKRGRTNLGYLGVKLE